MTLRYSVIPNQHLITLKDDPVVGQIADQVVRHTVAGVQIVEGAVAQLVAGLGEVAAYAERAGSVCRCRS